MEQLLSYEQILQNLIDFSNRNEQDEINQNEAYKLLNHMSLQNGHTDFSYDIAVELFDRILSYNNPIRIGLLATVIMEANDIIINKYTYSMNREMYIEEQKAFLKQIIPYGQETFLEIEKIKIQDPIIQRPYLVIHIGQFLSESEVAGTFNNGWYEWVLNIRIPIRSLIPDLNIELLENQNIVANLQLPCEALPLNDVKEAELQMHNQQNATLIYLQCKLMIGNNHKELVEEKMIALENQTALCQEELFMLQSQLNELCKPFLKEINMQPKQTTLSLPGRSYLNSYEIFANIPNKNSLVPSSLQATAFKNTSSAIGFKKKIIEHEQIRSFPIMARIDFLATVIALISMIINCYTPDLISVTYLMIIIMSIMLKHKSFLIYLITFLIIGLTIDIVTLSLWSFGVFAILFIVLNMLLKTTLLILSGMLMNNPENMYVLKTKLLLPL